MGILIRNISLSCVPARRAGRNSAMAFLCGDNTIPDRSSLWTEDLNSGVLAMESAKETAREINYAGPLNRARETLPVNDTPEINIHFHTKALNESPTFRVM
jgi:hypothetical protein